MTTQKVYVNARFLTQKLTGVQRFAIEISLILHEILGDAVVFLAPDETIEKANFPSTIPVLKIGRNKGHIWEQIDLPLYLRRLKKPLLINLCNAAPLLYANKLSTIHDIAFLKYPNTYSKSFLMLYRFMIPRIIASSEHTFTVSEFSKEEVVRYYSKESLGKDISVIYNAVDDDFKSVVDPDLQSVPYLVAVSSLNERKNLHAVLESFVNLGDEFNDTHLYIIGDLKSDSFKTLNFDRYKANPRIKFLGRVNDAALIRYYSNAKAFIYPSLYEGFGIPPLEAQKCGCPVIVSNVSSLPEVFQESALYCDPYSIVSLKNAIEEILTNDDRRNILIEKGYENVQRFSWLSSGEKVIEVLKKYL